MEAMIGTILPWAPNWAPQDWMLCNGQLLSTNQYAALYSLLGNYYGGDKINFQLPNLSGRVPMGMGTNGSVNYQIGQVGGNAQVTLTPAQAPVSPHIHAVASTAALTGGNTGTASVEIKIPVNTDAQPSPMPTPATYVNTPGSTCVLGQAKAGAFPGNIYTTNTATSNANLKPFNTQANITVSVPTVNVTSTCSASIASAAQAFSVMPPYQVVNYIICVNGYYPSRP